MAAVLACTPAMPPPFQPSGRRAKFTTHGRSASLSSPVSRIAHRDDEFSIAASLHTRLIAGRGARQACPAIAFLDVLIATPPIDAVAAR